MIKYLTFDTCPDLYINGKEENENYDNELRLFAVPKDWAVTWIRKTYDMTLGEFLMEYIWDMTYHMFICAKDDGTLIEEAIIER